LGKLGGQGIVQMLLWSPKMMWANVRVLTGEFGTGGLHTRMAKQQAALNLAKIVAETGAMAAIFNAIWPSSVELDPRSTDWLRVKDKTGHTRFDLTFGRGKYVTIAARTICWAFGWNAVKDKYGVLRKLNDPSKYKGRTMRDVGIEFFANSTRPIVNATLQHMEGRDYGGKRPTKLKSATKAVTPISAQNFYKNAFGEEIDKTGAAIVASILDLVGISASTY
jgi:hypothetical protein